MCLCYCYNVQSIKRIRIDAPEGDGNYEKTFLSLQCRVRIRIDAPEGDGNEGLYSLQSSESGIRIDAPEGDGN